jgi:hypothetical protein
MISVYWNVTMLRPRTSGYPLSRVFDQLVRSFKYLESISEGVTQTKHNTSYSDEFPHFMHASS